MDSFGTFLYQSGLSIAVFYLFYWALLRRETWFSLNRLLLGGSLLLAVTIPFVKITLHAAPAPGTLYYAVDHYLMDGAVVRPASLAEHAGIRLTAGRALLAVYLAGALFFLVRFGVQIIQVLRLVRRYGIREFEGYRIVPVDGEIAPFSFFTLIFINTEKIRGEELHKILLHEWEHVRRLHTLDILLLEVICILQWFNPFVWLYKYSLHELHEYEADQAVLRRGGSRLSYQQLILSQAFGHNFFPVVSELVNRSFIKKRIIMITRQKSRNITLLKSLLILPVAAILVVSFSFTREPANLQQVKNFFTGPENTEALSPQKKLYTLKEVDKQPRFQGKPVPFFGLWIKDQLKDSPVFDDKPFFVSCTVTPKGKVTDITITPDNVVIAKKDIRQLQKIIASSPLWTPGEKDGQKVAVRIGPVPANTKMVKNKENGGKEVFFIVEEMPKFEGKDINHFRDWVAENIRYPKIAEENGIGGKVFVRFIVYPDGHVGDVKVVRGVDPALDAEAVRVISSSPKWEPGKQRGKKVAVAYTVPIVFLMDKKEEKPAPVASEGGEIFFIVEQMPKFQGGDIKKFLDWVGENLKYPDEAAEKGISGRVLVQFIVETDGSVSHVMVKKGVDPLLDAEAVRVVSSSPKWEPGMQRGKRVRVQETVPIVFVMDHPNLTAKDLKNFHGKNIVYVLDGKKITEEELKQLDAAHIARVEVSTNEQDKKKYGPGAGDGVIFITTYKNVPEGETPPRPPKK